MQVGNNMKIGQEWNEDSVETGNKIKVGWKCGNRRIWQKQVEHSVEIRGKQGKSRLKIMLKQNKNKILKCENNVEIE